MGVHYEKLNELDMKLDEQYRTRTEQPTPPEDLTGLSIAQMKELIRKQEVFHSELREVRENVVILQANVEANESAKWLENDQFRKQWVAVHTKSLMIKDNNGPDYRARLNEGKMAIVNSHLNGLIEDIDACRQEAKAQFGIDTSKHSEEELAELASAVKKMKKRISKLDSKFETAQQVIDQTTIDKQLSCTVRNVLKYKLISIRKEQIKLREGVEEYLKIFSSSKVGELTARIDSITVEVNKLTAEAALLKGKGRTEGAQCKDFELRADEVNASVKVICGMVDAIYKDKSVAKSYRKAFHNRAIALLVEMKKCDDLIEAKFA